MKIPMRWKLLKTLALVSSVLALTSHGKASSTPVFAESEYSSIAIVKGKHYRIESNGEAFYISFGKTKNADETARFSYIFDEFSFSGDDLGKAGLFASSKSDADISYDLDEKKDFKTILEGSYPANSDVTRDEWVSSRTLAASRTNVFYSLLFYKSSETSQAEAIIRDNVYKYQNMGFGKYDDTNGMDGCYGCYFDGASVTLSFLATFTYGSDFTLHYKSGVNVVVDEETVSATLDAEDYELLDEPIGDCGGQAIYNRSLCFFPLKEKPEPDDMTVEYDHIEINGIPDENLSFISDGTRLYLITKLNDGDIVKIATKKKAASEDKNVQIHDLLEVAGVTEASFTELHNAYQGLGNIPNEPNHAFRFVLNTPKVASGKWNGEKQTKFGIWISNSSFWSNFGYIIRFIEGRVEILTGEEVALAMAESEVIAPSSSLGVVVGMAKITDGAANGDVLDASYNITAKPISSFVFGNTSDNEKSAIYATLLCFAAAVITVGGIFLIRKKEEKRQINNE